MESTDVLPVLLEWMERHFLAMPQSLVRCYDNIFVSAPGADKRHSMAMPLLLVHDYDNVRLSFLFQYLPEIQ